MPVNWTAYEGYRQPSFTGREIDGETVLRPMDYGRAIPRSAGAFTDAWLVDGPAPRDLGLPNGVPVERKGHPRQRETSQPVGSCMARRQGPPNSIRRRSYSIERYVTKKPGGPPLKQHTPRRRAAGDELLGIRPRCRRRATSTQQVFLVPRVLPSLADMVAEGLPRGERGRLRRAWRMASLAAMAPTGKGGHEGSATRTSAPPTILESTRVDRAEAGLALRAVHLLDEPSTMAKSHLTAWTFPPPSATARIKPREASPSARRALGGLVEF